MKQIFSEIRKPSDNSIRHLWRFLPVVLGIAGLVCISGVEGKAQETSLLRQSVGDNDSIGDGTNTVENTNAETPVFSADLDAPTDNGAASNDLVLPANSAVSGRTAVVSNSNNNLRSTSRLRENPVGELDANGQFDSRGNRPAVPVEGGGAVSTSNPYAATGLRLGTFDLFPTLEQSVGYSSNADEDENGAASGYSQTSVGLRLRSNWAIHQFEAELGATYQRFFNGQSENLPTANANASLRLDVGREYTVLLMALMI